LLGSDPNGQWLIEITDFWPHEKGNIKSAVLEFGEYEQPQCSSLSFPENGSFNIPINSIFNWDSSPLATSYYLNLGITPGGNEIYDQLDVGNVLSYDPGLLECETDYYISIIPYNEYGPAVGCAEEHFSTEFVEVTSSGDIEVCKGDFVSLWAEGGVEYEWFPADYLDNINIQSPISTTPETITYSVVAYNENGCNDTTSLAVTVNEVEIHIDSVHHVKTGIQGFIHISVNDDLDDYTYSWTGPNGFTASTQDIDNLDIGCYDLTVTNLVTACSSETTICVDDLTDTPIFGIKENIKIYPNPTKGVINIETEDPNNRILDVTLYDMIGEKILDQNNFKTENKIILKLNEAKSGVYLINIRTTNGFFRKEVFINKFKSNYFQQIRR